MTSTSIAAGIVSEPTTVPDDLPQPVLPPNAEVVLNKRYLRKGGQGEILETPQELYWRVASAIAAEEAKYPASPYSVDELARRFYELMTTYRFLPNSPTLMNAGTDLGQLAACFVLPVGDSMEEIFDAIKYAALIHKSGGGTGFSFSRLRPQKSRVGSTGGIASGPISFLRIFNTATEQVKQGGTRRGANMGILRVDHPDVLDFIRAKERDGDLNNFNLSIGLTEVFMQAVEKDEEYDLVAPHTKQAKARLKAREVFGLLVQKAWESGDPGIIFLDRINRDNPTPKQGEIESTNPCVTSETFVMTDVGPRQVHELIGRPVNLVVNGQAHPSTDHGFFATGRKPVFHLQTKEGHSLLLTADHPVLQAASPSRYALNPQWTRAEDLAPDDKIVLHDHRTITGWPGAYGLAEGYLLGLLVGDGTLKTDKAVLSVWPRARTVNGEDDPCGTLGVMTAAETFARTLPHRGDFQGWQTIAGRNECRMCLSAVRDLALGLGMAPGRKTITEQLEQTSSEFYQGFLGGLFDADGSVQGNQRKGVSIRLAQSDLERLFAVQRMLLRLGIASTIHQNRRPAGVKVLPDGKGGSREYPVQAQHELIISGANLERFAEVVGFQDTAKRDLLVRLLGMYRRSLNRERFLATVKSLDFVGERDVYDVTVPEVHAFDANGFMVHNCGEQPLLPYEACNLGSINLSRYVQNSGKDDILWDDLKRDIHLCVRFLDNVIDASRYPLEKITETVRMNRKIGLGVMGWADLLYRLHIPYNSQEALNLAEKIMHFVQFESQSASKKLAEERGPFPAFADSTFAEHNQGPFRNATTTTIAPTGTLSILAGCSSGVEPLFALSFVRQVMDGERLLEANPWFEQALHEAECFSPKLMEEVAAKGTIHHIDYLPEDVRKVFVTAHDIEPIWHLKMQAAFQKFTDNAVSKTVNLPHAATQEDIWKIYWMAYEMGCKGVTVYRDGCKSTQVLCTGDGGKPKEPEKSQRVVRDRPDVVYGFTQKVKTGYGFLYLTVNEVDGRPFEVFTTIGKSGRSITAKAEAIGRLVSLALRSGVGVEDIVSQLKGIGGEHPVFQKKDMLLSIPDAVSWVLESRYLQGRKAEMSNQLVKPECPDCGKELIFQEGCFVCQGCGYTKCG
ncbi:ribonucleoside-diphosphate reductase class II [Desulfonatronum zhilinae]|nr:ribonucleoside-diphosphate reductase class II [Desulfonatronum zhilinae]